MAGFWAPYADFNEARTRLCRLADAAVGPQSGVSFSDGQSIAVLRQAVAPTGDATWLNVLCQHVAAPKPAPPSTKARGRLGRLKAWFWRVTEVEGQVLRHAAQITIDDSHFVAQEFRDHVWEPTHAFLLRHKLLADTAGIALDAVGVAAALVFIFVAAPELAIAAAAGGVAAGVGLLTGASASVGALVLFGIDGAIYGAEVSGDEAYAKKLEDNPTLGWMRIGATVMLLPDLPVGAMRALKEIGQTAGEASEAIAKTEQAEQLTGIAARDLKNVTHPSRHPAEVARQMDRIRKYAEKAKDQTKLVEAANAKIKLLLTRDVVLFPGATVGGAALLIGAPPDVVLSEAQKRRDEDLLKSLAPAAGMPKDARMDLRVISYSSARKL